MGIAFETVRFSSRIAGEAVIIDVNALDELEGEKDEQVREAYSEGWVEGYQTASVRQVRGRQQDGIVARAEDVLGRQKRTGDAFGEYSQLPMCD